MSTDRKRQARRDADEIAATAQYIIDSGQDTGGRAVKYLTAYDFFQSAADEKARTESGSPERKLVHDIWRDWVTTEGLTMFAGDDRGARYLRTLSSALEVTVEGL